MAAPFSFYPQALMCTIEESGWEKTSSLLSVRHRLVRNVSPHTEREKIGHFHIYSSVRSRAVYGEEQREREEGGLQPQELWGFTSLPPSLFSICERTHTPLPAWTHNKGRRKKGGKRKKVEGERVGSEDQKQGCAVCHGQKNKTCTRQWACE